MQTVNAIGKLPLSFFSMLIHELGATELRAHRVAAPHSCQPFLWCQSVAHRSTTVRSWETVLSASGPERVATTMSSMRAPQWSAR